MKDSVSKSNMDCEFSTDHFRCKLVSRQCFWKGGCKRKITIGLPYCWQHTKRAFNVQVKDSRIPNAGKGLFALTDFSHKQPVVPYFGETLTQEQIETRYPGDSLAPYVEKLGDTSQFLDAACVRSIGSMINGSGDRRECNCEAVMSKSKKFVVIRTIQPVKQGDEFILWYGKNYFNGPINQNITKCTTKKKKK